MRERKGEYFLKIVNEERYQQLFDHPEELRKIIITTTHERYEMYAKLQDALASLPPNDFVQCHRSYIVAFRHIEQICGNEILLSNGQRLPIGRTFMQPLKEALMQRQFSS